MACGEVGAVVSTCMRTRGRGRAHTSSCSFGSVCWPPTASRVLPSSAHSRAQTTSAAAPYWFDGKRPISASEIASSMRGSLTKKVSSGSLIHSAASASTWAKNVCPSSTSIGAGSVPLPPW